MTTKVTVTASGPNYPARLVKKTYNKTIEADEEKLNVLIASGFTYETWCGTDDVVTVIEEYHPNGYTITEKQ